jgi:hypothetical protein
MILNTWNGLVLPIDFYQKQFPENFEIQMILQKWLRKFFDFVFKKFVFFDLFSTFKTIQTIKKPPN